jgi:cardiolipin synthase
MIEYVNGNHITLLKTGAEYFPALIAECDAARHDIHLETYILEADATGRAVVGALERAARRGVAVKVLVDGFGSQDLDPALVAALRRAGVRFLIYRQKISPWTLRRARLRRMHRKIAVVDGRVAFVGGINVVDDVDKEEPTAPPRFDYAVRVEGPLVARILGAVKRLWLLVCATQLRRRWAEGGAATPPEFRGNQRAAFVIRDNIGHRREIEQAYLAAIGQARREVVMANAYFFPGRTFRRSLVNAARRGVRVVLLLQGKAEYFLQHYASHALYGPLLDAGIEIYDYQRSFLHAKVAVVDGHWATVGSSNIDPFSLLLAREANVVIEDAGFAGELRASLFAAMADGAVQVKRESWRDQPWTTRALIHVSYEIVRFVTGVFAYGRTEEFT